jgi:hypothetical protein
MSGVQTLACAFSISRGNDHVNFDPVGPVGCPGTVRGGSCEAADPRPILVEAFPATSGLGLGGRIFTVWRCRYLNPANETLTFRAAARCLNHP